MNIAMPEVKSDTSDWETCKPLLVRNKDDGHISTVIIGCTQVLFFDKDNTITHGSVSYLKNEYELIREYNPGETLSITV